MAKLRSPETRKYLQYIAANVITWRVQRGLTQEQLAERAFIDTTYLQRVERATANMSVDVLVSIAEVLDIVPTALFAEAKLQPARHGRPPKKKS